MHRPPLHTAGAARGSSPAPVRTLTRDQCLERLKVCTVGRVGYVGRHGVEIIPVNYRLVGQTLALATTPRSSLAQLGEIGCGVTFEVDYHGPNAHLAWSVMMRGRLTELEVGGRERMAALRPPLDPWPGGTASIVLEFVPQTFSGRVLERNR